MKTLSIETTSRAGRRHKPSRLDKLARRAVRARLLAIREGRVVVTENGRRESFGKLTQDMPHTAHITINDPRFYSDIAFSGVIGSGEAYIRGYWSCREMTTLVRILLRNRQVLEHMDSGAALVSRPLQKFLHWLNKNTQSGSRRNISAHYDLGNDFYRLWLDERMMYSSAIYDRPEMTLDAAGTAKLDRICRKLRLSPEDHVIEIGSGWGGFAIYAARNYGCKVTTTTISQQQYDYAQRAIKEAGLGDRIELLMRDYRDLEGKFDKLVSIEMVEAVGWQYHDTFFAKCNDLLKPDGEMLIQAITIADQYYEKYRKSVDFIRRYIFPGGCLLSVTAMSNALTRVTDMRSIHIEDIGPHYARTLRDWRDRFERKLDDVRRQGYSDDFIRMWRFYLAYCEGAFLERTIGDVQMHSVKPMARTDAIGL